MTGLLLQCLKNSFAKATALPVGMNRNIANDRAIDLVAKGATSADQAATLNCENLVSAVLKRHDDLVC